MMTLPNLELPIEDENAAAFWRDHFSDQFRATNDMAFQEAHAAVVAYIDDIGSRTFTDGLGD